MIIFLIEEGFIFLQTKFQNDVRIIYNTSKWNKGGASHV
jgi:hypothetical protein